MKKRFWAVLAVLLCMTGCQGNVGAGQADTAQVAAESQQTTSEVTTEQTSKIIETTTSTTAAEEVSADIAVSREYEFDLDKFLENGKHDVFLLRNELDFLSDEQYDTYIKALIFVDYLGNSSVVSTDSKSLHFINENGEISKSLISNESDTVQIYPYYYISTYKSFYEYLQSVFTQDAVDEIMSDERFFTFGDELYFKWQDSGGMVYFDDSEYNVIEENDSEIAFEYTAHKLINSEEWVCTRKTKLIHTDNGWRSEFFKNLYSEK
ncbi:MAG: hypothetical protein HDT25_08630 [Ruminococcus sp.]|nr:hypothetical protein [Ruminococcus sp.]